MYKINTIMNPFYIEIVNPQLMSQTMPADIFYWDQIVVFKILTNLQLLTIKRTPVRRGHSSLGDCHCSLPALPVYNPGLTCLHQVTSCLHKQGNQT